MTPMFLKSTITSLDGQAQGQLLFPTISHRKSSWSSFLKSMGSSLPVAHLSSWLLRVNSIHIMLRPKGSSTTLNSWKMSRARIGQSSASAKDMRSSRSSLEKTKSIPWTRLSFMDRTDQSNGSSTHKKPRHLELSQKLLLTEWQARIMSSMLIRTASAWTRMRKLLVLNLSWLLPPSILFNRKMSPSLIAWKPRITQFTLLCTTQNTSFLISVDPKNGNSPPMTTLTKLLSGWAFWSTEMPDQTPIGYKEMPNNKFDLCRNMASAASQLTPTQWSLALMSGHMDTRPHNEPPCACKHQGTHPCNQIETLYNLTLTDID